MAAALMPHAMSSRNSSRLRSLAGSRSRLIGPVAVFDAARDCLAAAGAPATLLFAGIAQLLHDRTGRHEVVGVDGLLHQLLVVLRQAVDPDVGLLVDVREADGAEVLLHPLEDG